MRQSGNYLKTSSKESSQQSVGQTSTTFGRSRCRALPLLKRVTLRIHLCSQQAIIIGYSSRYLHLSSTLNLTPAKSYRLIPPRCRTTTPQLLPRLRSPAPYPFLVSIGHQSNYTFSDTMNSRQSQEDHPRRRRYRQLLKQRCFRHHRCD